ncbi:MAG: hypothetical protein KDA85_15445, partial [Planctomycetaceae bacterium]|nr:hypothetical protein [Planctomycetaceae bacterium]
RRIQNGINGTPMPGFENRFSDEPEKIWDLVSFVLYSANRRRANNELPAGLLKPFQYEKVEAAADGEGAE